jgi:hypothetical protein
MRQLFTLRRGVSTLLIVALAALGLGLPSVEAFQSGNLLQNPGFEGAYVAINGDTSLQVAPNWLPWSLPQGSSSAINARPEYKPAPANRVRSGSAAQEYNTFFATHTGGVYQRVPVSPNTELLFSIYIYVWSSGTFANPDVSQDPNHVILNVGIDPTGGTDGTSSNIVWSADAEYYDQYRQMSVTATSQSTAVTVFVRSAPTGFVGTSLGIGSADRNAGPDITTTADADPDLWRADAGGHHHAGPDAGRAGLHTYTGAAG